MQCSPQDNKSAHLAFAQLMMNFPLLVNSVRIYLIVGQLKEVAMLVIKLFIGQL